MVPGRAMEAANDILFQRRQKAQEEAQTRRDALYAREPRFRDWDRRLGELTRGIAVAAISPDGEAESRRIMDEIRAVQEERRELLRAMDLTADHLEPRYVCPICKDTGRVEGRRCRCLEALLRAEGCRGLPAAALDGSCTFRTFDLRYYPDAPDQNGRSPRKIMSHTLDQCRNYSEHFGPESGSLLFFGRTGLGKTHLSLAIAGEVAARGAAVLYSPVQGIIDRYERVKFDRNPSAEDRDFVAMAPRCDLLVIDDLGSEFSTAFSQSVLYNLLNERMNAGLPMILSTNLSVDQLSEAYNERVVSRILCGCVSYTFIGRDIRFIKQMEKKKQRE